MSQISMNNDGTLSITCIQELKDIHEILFNQTVVSDAFLFHSSKKHETTVPSFS